VYEANIRQRSAARVFVLGAGTSGEKSGELRKRSTRFDGWMCPEQALTTRQGCAYRDLVFGIVYPPQNAIYYLKNFKTQIWILAYLTKN